MLDLQLTANKQGNLFKLFHPKLLHAKHFVCIFPPVQTHILFVTGILNSRNQNWDSRNTAYHVFCISVESCTFCTHSLEDATNI